MSVGEAKALIQQGIQAVNEGRRTLGPVVVETAEADAAARLTLHGSRHTDVEKGLAALKEAEHELELTLRRFHGSVDAASAYLSTLG